MVFLDTIAKKRDGGALSREEIEAFALGAARGEIPEIQLAAMLMAIAIRGMDDRETADLTRAMAESGTRVDFGPERARAVDKHSTGGVGDKISLIVAPAVAACGALVPMISGRALGHTGGTLDKLESIPGFRTAWPLDRVRSQTLELGLCFAAATEDLAPADRVLYRLRDLTATVPSVPLICSSILSKKVAEGIGSLVLDVKVGSGAFLPDEADARRLAEALVTTARGLGLRCEALLTRMDRPLGLAVGNAPEVAEALEVLRGGGPPDVREVTLALGAPMLRLAGLAGDDEEGRRLVGEAIDSGRAFDKFVETAVRQGADRAALEDPRRLPQATASRALRAKEDGYVRSLDARAVGEAARLLGAGRLRPGDEVDPSAGLLVRSPVGRRVARGDVVLELRTSRPETLEAAAAVAERAIGVGPEPPDTSPPLVLGRIPERTGD